MEEYSMGFFPYFAETGKLKPLSTVMVAHVYRQLIEIGLIHVAPSPIFIGFVRLNYRMPGLVVMFRGMLILRIVAAAYVPAGLAQA